MLPYVLESLIHIQILEPNDGDLNQRRPLSYSCPFLVPRPMLEDAHLDFQRCIKFQICIQ